MERLNAADVDLALDRASKEVAAYTWLQVALREVDVGTDSAFQRRYMRHHRFWRTARWRKGYFGLMEVRKGDGVGFGEALAAVRAATGKVEPVLSSKLVATLDPGLPALDELVLGPLGLSLPNPTAADYEARLLKVYAELRERYATILATEEGRLVYSRFVLKYPAANVSDVKKVELVLRQHLRR